MALPFLLGMTGIFKSKWVWVGLAIVAIGGGIYAQHRSIVNLELENQTLVTQAFQLEAKVAEERASRAKLIEDIARMNEINNQLAAGKVAAEERLEVNRQHLTDVLTQLPKLTTPKQVEEVRSQVKTIVVRSYGCLEAATGKVNASCD